MNSLGYDYATKPIVLVAGDIQFIELLQSGFVALAYTVAPEFGLLADAPVLAMVFETTEKARKCFEHFIDWNESSGKGDAVRLSFVELEDGGYALCTSQDIKRLADRVLAVARYD
jgi:hypothetical protein